MVEARQKWNWTWLFAAFALSVVRIEAQSASEVQRVSEKNNEAPVGSRNNVPKMIAAGR